VSVLAGTTYSSAARELITNLMAKYKEGLFFLILEWRGRIHS
jgi:hypothetical protein